MTSSAAHLSLLALLLSASAGLVSAATPEAPPLIPAQGESAVLNAAPEQSAPALGLAAEVPAGDLRVLDDAHRPPPQYQVRIESRVVIRISPSPQAQREQLLAALPRRPINTSFAEVAHGDCVPVEAIAGVQPTDDDRLLLFLRDRRILTAALERSCSARAFYSGFYMERSEDGQLCIARDRLHARSGASCQVGALRQLVAVRD